MSRILVKIKDRYFEWSTVVDAPVTYGLTLPQLRHYVKEEYGRQGLEELPERLERCDKQGHSSFGIRESLTSFLACNRAGPKGVLQQAPPAGPLCYSTAQHARMVCVYIYTYTYMECNI